MDVIGRWWLNRAWAVPLSVLIVSAAGFVAVYSIGVRTSVGQLVENRALDASTFLNQPGGLLSLVTTVNIAIALAGLVLIGLLSRRFRPTIRVVAIVTISLVLSQTLKHGVLDRPDYLGSVSANTLPSGHTVAYASIMLGLLIVLPRRVRTIAALLAAAVLSVVVFQLLAFGWHRASDVVAGLLLVTAVVALTQLVLPDRAPLRARSRGLASQLLIVAAVILVGATIAFAIVLAFDRSLATTHALLLASQIVSLATVAVAVVATLVMQRADARPTRQSTAPNSRGSSVAATTPAR